MTVFEVRGGPVTARYLNRKTRHELVRYISELRAILKKPPYTASDVRPSANHLKFYLVREAMTLVRELPE